MRPHSPFAQRLAGVTPDPSGRRWLYVPYDQLGHHLGPLADAPAHELGVVLVEHPGKAARRPYRQQKLAYVLANGRHFALELAARGVAVRHVVAKTPTYRDTLRPLAAELGPLAVMEPAERELRRDLQPLLDEGALVALPHPGWLTTRADFVQGTGAAPPWRMDRFYKHVRRRTGVLMDGRGKPMGGRFSFDGENRQPWKGEPPAPTPPTFAPDAVTQEVGDLIARRFGHHPGTLDLTALPATQADAERVWAWAKAACLPHFGPWEDAMSRRSHSLFHTRLSPLLNLQRLSAQRVLDDALALDIPLNSKEGFVRQLIGWREFVRHVHRDTDGFRTQATTRDGPGDGGWGRWRGAEWPGSADPQALGGADPQALVGTDPVPPAFWGTPSGLSCLDTVVAELWATGYTHHIPRLMVLANLATLLGVAPRDLADWFWVAYVDAYDWVVEPNVLGMGTYGVGDLMTTKPYVSGAAYIDKMSDYCQGCAFDPKTTCPITRLYWAFLARNTPALADNMRVKLPLASCRKRSAAQQAEDERVFAAVRAALQAGERLTPDALAGQG
ncbi:MAG: cryptochrome/photolyase family protein [Myxococcales bacterium]|nr:cryptochrome/photolyase family protein [Myxococcales bacterium]